MTSPAPDGGWSWLVVVGISIINLSLLPLVHCFGLVFEEKFQALGIGTAQTSFLLHLNSSFTCSLGLVSAPLLRRFSFRQVALLGCAVASVGICLTSLAGSMAGFVATYCVLLGLGQGVLYPATSLALNSHFKQRRSAAMGLTITATGLGPTVTPQLTALLLDRYGSSGTVLLLGGGALHSLLGAALLRPVPAPPRQGKLLTILVGEESSVDTPPKEQPALGSSYINAGPGVASTRSRLAAPVKRLCFGVARALDLGLLRDPVYLNIVAGMGVSFVAELNFNMLTPFILAELAGLPRARVATLMSVQAAADILARLLVPLAADTWRWGARTLYVLSLLGSVLGRSVLAYFHSSLPLLMCLAVLLGVAKGVKAVFQALIVPNYVPLERLAAASGLLMLINGVLSLCLGPVIGLVRDASNSHVLALHATSAMSLLCVLLWVAEALLWYHRRDAHRDACTTDTL